MVTIFGDEKATNVDDKSLKAADTSDVKKGQTTKKISFTNEFNEYKREPTSISFYSLFQTI